MKKLVLNDSRQIEVQSASASAGVFRARMINTNIDTLEAMFSSEFATQKMTLVENNKVTNSFENYTVFKSVKKECGGIYEVELVQAEADTATKIANLEKKAQENEETIQQGLAEITMLISSLIGGVADVQ